MTTRNQKYLAACRLTRVRGENAHVYAALNRAGFAWDSDAGWYCVEEPADGRVKVRLVGRFADVVAAAAKLGLEVEAEPGRAREWLAYAEIRSGASKTRRRRPDPEPEPKRRAPRAAPAAKPTKPAAPPAPRPVRPPSRQPQPPLGFSYRGAGNVARERMETAAEDEDFESAAALRDEAGLRPRSLRARRAAQTGGAP